MSEIEWQCPECDRVGSYYEIRRIIDSGVDRCPDCSCEVECIDEEEL